MKSPTTRQYGPHVRSAPTLVTCLYDLARREGSNRRSAADYCRLAPRMLSTRVPVVVYADPEHVEALREIRGAHAPGVPTQFVPRPFEDLLRYGELTRITRCLEDGRRSPAAQNLEKDTGRYHVLTWSKIDLLAEVADDDPFGSTHFWFGDLGLAHVARSHPDRSLADLLVAAGAPLHFTLFHETAPVQVADRSRYFATEDEPRVCGALFGGDRASIAQLATWFDAEVQKSLEVGHPALEQVLLAPVLAEHRSAFTVAYATSAGVIENLVEPRSEAWLLCRVLAQCRDLGLHEVGLDLASRIERAWRAGTLELSWQEVARLHSDGAAIAWDAGQPAVAVRAQTQLAELIERAPTSPENPGRTPAGARRLQTVALCMIVRDEAAVIDRCLRSVRELIDTWVIVDTGSSDGTPQRIEQALKGIPGTLHRRTWHDFAHNRTELMELARGAADYLLLFDADMTLEPDTTLPELHADAYLARHAGSLDYAVPRLVRGDRAWHYVGATHEHLAWDGDRSIEELANLCITHHGDGSSHAVKLDRDRQLLEQELGDKPEDPLSNLSCPRCLSSGTSRRSGSSMKAHRGSRSPRRRDRA